MVVIDNFFIIFTGIKLGFTSELRLKLVDNDNQKMIMLKIIIIN